MVNINKRNFWYLLATLPLVWILYACGTAFQETEKVSSPTEVVVTDIATEAKKETETVSNPESFTSQQTAEVSIPIVVAATQAEPTANLTCELTAPDMLGPFYEPDAPVRNSVGEGYILNGVVRSVVGCAPIPEARIEFWLAGPDGQYSDKYRATVIADENGTYHFESFPPPPYSGRPSHIHIRVTASGFQELVTQQYPQPGQTEAQFDLVIQP